MNREFITKREWMALMDAKHLGSSRRITIACGIITAIICMAVIPTMYLQDAIARQTTGDASVLTGIQVLKSDTDGRSLTTTAIKGIRSMKHVSDIVPADGAGVYADDPEDGWNATLYAARPSNVPKGVTTQQIRGLTDDQIIVPSKLQGHDMTTLVGKTISVSYTRGTGSDTGTLTSMSLSVIGAYDGEWKGLPTGAFLGSSGLVTQLLAARVGVSSKEFVDKVGYESVMVNVDDTDNVSSVASAIERRGFTVVSEKDTMGDIPVIFTVIPWMVAGLYALFLVLMAYQIVMTIRSAMERRLGEFGLLRIRGYDQRDIQNIMVHDVIHGGVFGVAAGFVSGSLLGVAGIAGYGAWSSLAVDLSSVLRGLLISAAASVGLVAAVSLIAMQAVKRVMADDAFALLQARYA